MNRKFAATAILSLLLGCISSFADADSWPRWRGPEGTGHSSDKDLPVTWDTSSIVWQTQLKGEGQSTPILWDDRIFLTSAVDKGKKRLVICLDRRNGKILWQKVAWTGKPEPTHKLNGWATPTCVTDGKHVYAAFGKAGIHCYTLDGKHVWSRDLGEFLSKRKRGTAASPILVGNVLIWNGDSDSDPYLFGLDKRTGKTLWKSERPATEGYSTPIVVEANGRTEVVLNGHYFVGGYDPKTGKLLWQCKSFAGRGEPTPTIADGVIYVVNGQPGDIYAVKPGGSGNVTKTHMVWHTRRRNGRDQPSPIVVDDYLVVSNIAGIAICYHAQSGKELWKERISNSKIMSSPIAAGGLVYFTNEAGETIVIDPGPKLEIVATNPITKAREIFRASPTPFRGQMFLRSQDKLYCVGKK